MFLWGDSSILVWLAVSCHRWSCVDYREDFVVQLRYRVRLFVLITGLLGMLIVACGGDAPSAAPSAAATSTTVATTAPTTVVVAVTPSSLDPTAQPIYSDVVDGEPALAVFKVTDRSIEAPEHIPAGLTTIRLENAGTVEHSLVIFDIDEGHTVANVALELTGQFWPESWAPSVGQVTAGVGESSEWTVRLKKGLYAATDWTNGSDSVPHVARGVFTGFEVSAAEVSPVAWNSEAVEIELEDFAFTGLKDLEAGRNDFRFVNKSATQDHMVGFVLLEEGESVVEMFGDWVSAIYNGTKTYEPVGGVDWIGPGQEVEYSVDLDAGRYGMVCLLPDSHPGTPHSNLGMLGEFTVK